MIEMKSVFGGIWKDAAVEQPPEKVAGGRLFVIEKASGGCWCMEPFEVALNFGKGKDATGYWWMDQRAPTKLSPREAFDLLKVLEPAITGISMQGYDLILHYGNTRSNLGIPASLIRWGGPESYTPPPEEKWIDATLENWKDFLLKRCRFVASDGRMVHGVLVGMSPTNCWLVDLVRPCMSGDLAFVPVATGQLQFSLGTEKEVVK